ncbi:Uncharacterised protein [Mycobacteroides abscessus subsp. abscessus]|nr:Uncharacterised protein [Mycobacteroides abscessus subsp. abscessus]
MKAWSAAWSVVTSWFQISAIQILVLQLQGFSVVSYGDVHRWTGSSSHFSLDSPYLRSCWYYNRTNDI